MINVFLLLGSNLGNRHLFLQQAVKLINQDIAPVIFQSGIYETQSWGNPDAPDYLNQVIEINTNLPADTVLQNVLAIEQFLGRERKEKWGSRVIDIDILFYGSEVISKPGLEIPHPRLHNRRFTLEPLVELAPKFIHPVLKKSILQLKSELTDDLVVKKV